MDTFYKTEHKSKLLFHLISLKEFTYGSCFLHSDNIYPLFNNAFIKSLNFD